MKKISCLEFEMNVLEHDEQQAATHIISDEFQKALRRMSTMRPLSTDEGRVIPTQAFNAAEGAKNLLLAYTPDNYMAYLTTLQKALEQIAENDIEFFEYASLNGRNLLHGIKAYGAFVYENKDDPDFEDSRRMALDCHKVIHNYLLTALHQFHRFSDGKPSTVEFMGTRICTDLAENYREHAFHTFILNRKPEDGTLQLPNSQALAEEAIKIYTELYSDSVFFNEDEAFSNLIRLAEAKQFFLNEETCKKCLEYIAAAERVCGSVPQVMRIKNFYIYARAKGYNLLQMYSTN